MNTEERIGKAERRIKTVEDAIVLLTALTDSHNGRLESSLNNDEVLNVKISALIDAQIRSEDAISVLINAEARNEDTISALVDTQIRTESTISALVGAQIKSEDKISALVDAQIRSEDKISALVDAQIRSEDKLQNINSALEQLTRLVEKAHSRIDGLES